MIESISFSKFHNPELLNFMYDEVRDARAVGSAYLNPILDEMDKSLALLDKAIIRVVNSDLSSKLRSIDEVRVKSFRCLVGCVRGEAYRWEEERRLASARISKLIKAYGRIDVKSIRNKNELMENLIRDLRSDQYKNDVKLLNVKPWVDNMDAANKEFDKIFDLREATWAKRVAANTVQIRNQIYQHYKQLMQVVLSIQTLSPDDKIRTFISLHNERAGRMKSLFARRNSISNSTKAKTHQEIEKMLAPLLQEFAQERYPTETFRYAGQTYGTGINRLYYIAAMRKEVTPFWVIIKDGQLQTAAKPSPKPSLKLKPAATTPIPNMNDTTPPTPDDDGDDDNTQPPAGI